MMEFHILLVLSEVVIGLLTKYSVVRAMKGFAFHGSFRNVEIARGPGGKTFRWAYQIHTTSDRKRANAMTQRIAIALSYFIRLEKFHWRRRNQTSVNLNHSSLCLLEKGPEVSLTDKFRSSVYIYFD